MNVKLCGKKEHARVVSNKKVEAKKDGLECHICPF